MKRIAGTCFVKIDGDQFDLKGGVECPVSNNVKETQMGTNGPGGYSEMAQRPFIKLTAFVPPNFPLATISSRDDMTITAELANGKVYVLSNAWLEGEATVKNDDGTTDLEFSGMNGQWQ